MCGILGVTGPCGGAVVRRLVDDLAHRGPDGRGVWSSPQLTLGHRRLAIIGLDEGGAQPMWSPSGRSVLAFNGEIYNYLELADELEQLGRRTDRRYDTAVLLTALETWGIDALPRLNGMFAFAWYDPEARKILLARDRWGEKPLFWGHVRVDGDSRAWVFASELRSFTRLPAGAPAHDPLGIVRYLVYDGMPDERTVYKDVYKVPASGWISIDQDGERITRGTYWAWRPAWDPNPDRHSLATGALNDLSSSIALRLRSDVPVGLFLSGGLDSSLLAALWRRRDPDRTIHTFTVGFEEPSYDERAYANTVAQLFRTEHHECVLSGADLETELDAVWNHSSEPFSDPSIVATSFLCRIARRHVGVALAGEGADEIQAGYDPFRAWAISRVMETVLPRRLWRRLFEQLEQWLPPDPANVSTRFKIRHFGQGFCGPADERIQHWMASFPVPAALAAVRPEIRAEVEADEVLEPTRAAYNAVRSSGPLHAQMHVWLKTYLECCVLAKVDRASMAHSLEVRAPYLDPDVVSRFSNLPPWLIYADGRGKQLLRSSIGDLLPSSVLNRPKKGFGLPQAAWLRTYLRDRMEDAIRRSRIDGWYQADVIERMWKAHLAGSADYRRSLWNFLFSFAFVS